MKHLALQAVKFGLVGVINTCVGLGTIFAMMYFFDTHPYLANATGYVFGLLVSFTLNNKWTFNTEKKEDNAKASLFLKFLVAFGISYGLNFIVLTAGLRSGINPYLTQVASLGTYSLCFFLLSKFYVFKEQKC